MALDFEPPLGAGEYGKKGIKDSIKNI